jgi:TatD DNase family protein
LRLDIVKKVSKWIKDNGGTVRINTNGHGNLIHKRNIVPELAGLVDSLSISLDAENEKKYEKVCRPQLKNAFPGMLAFVREAKKVIPEVKLTVVNVPQINIKKCEALAKELGVPLRIRSFNVVG